MKMDPFARKMWRAGLAYAGLLIALAAALTATYVHSRPRCGDRTVSESVSPDRRWTAAVLERRCGEDTPFITQINLRIGDQKLERGFFSGQANKNNIFAVEQDAAGAGITFEWNTRDLLTVHCRHCDTKYVDHKDTQLDTRQNSQSGALRILYDFSRP